MNKLIPQQNSRLPRSAGQAREISAWVRASGHERFWTAVACWMGSVSFAGPGQWLSGRPIRAYVWFGGELFLVGLWLLVAGATGGWPLGTMTVALAGYHLVSWVDAARCGWLFRKVIIESSLVRIVAMAGVVALAPMPAAMLVFGPGREFLVGEYNISESSMAGALLGQHAQLNCPSCGYAFDVGLRPSEQTYWPTAARSCPMCGQDELAVVNSIPPVRDRILASKRLSPRRWDLLMFRSPSNLSTLFIKRVVGLPGEELQIIEGEIFINGSLLSKRPLAQEEMWLSVLDSKFQAADLGAAKLRWQPSDEAVGWQGLGGSWLFDSGQDRSELLELRGELTDELAYNADALEYIKPDPIHDVRLGVRLSQFEGSGSLSLHWGHAGREVRASIDVGGAVELAVGGLGQEDLDISETAQLGRAVVELMLIVRDGYAYLYAEGELVAQAAVGPLGAEAAGRIRAGSCKLSIEAKNCRGRISRVWLDRDVHYRIMSAKPGWSSSAAVVRIPAGHYYVLGDNSSVSHDSRLGWPIHSSLEGRVQAGPVPAELIEGVVTSIYWPPARWRSFR